MTCPRPCRRGFTLVELMVALAIFAIVAAIAFPSYRSQVAKGRRADAKQSVMEVAQLLERFYSERGTYAGATLGSGGLYPSSSRQGFYTLAIANASADGYSLSATPTGAQAGDACGSYGYDQTGTASVSGGTLTLASCW